MSDAAPPDDIRPRVRLAGEGNRAAWIFAAIVGAGAILLFLALDDRRRELENPDAPVTFDGAPGIAGPPPLAIPSDEEEKPRYAYGYGPRILRPRDIQVAGVPVRTSAQTAPIPRSSPSAPPIQDTFAPAYPPRVRFTPPPVPEFDSPRAPAVDPGTARVTESQAGGLARVRATRLANPAYTVPQGTVIPAVLETALDSTRPGAVRAIVSRDVRGFDGSRVLIPRGSRLYGEYNAELAPGQNRALVQWKRLTRPDGVQIALDSPASDPLGRAGVKGKVDSHFLERFGGAILQSVLDAGVAFASRKASDGTVVVGLPGSTQTIASALAPREVQRTLKVRQGSSVSVFVARDLDFSPAEP